MLKNGQEVFSDDYSLTTVQAYNVQNKINAIPEFASDEKSDAIVNNGEVQSSENKSLNGTAQPFSLGMFETIGSTTQRRSLRTREQLYETYIKMGTLGLVQRALEIISDEATQKNDDDEVLFINSNNDKIEDALRELFFDKLSFNTELWSIVFETIKMGDNFYEITLDVKDGMASGIKRIKYLDPAKVEVHEKDGRVDYYVYKSNTKSKEVKLEQRLFPWQILHFKIENKETKPYGKSLLYPGIRSYERLTATEDIFLTYTISRTPSRRVFKIDVGGLPQLEAQRAIREMRDSYRAQQVIDNDGNLNQISNILSITSDIFIPVREGQSGTTIETLNGSDMNMNSNMSFLDNFKKDLIASFNIPEEYLGIASQGQVDRSATLSQKDIKFGRFVERLQEQISKTIYKLATLELFFKGFTGEELKDFTIEFTAPSTTKEASEVGFLETKINLIQQMQQLNIFPTNWLLKNVLKLSDREISEIQFMKTIEAKNDEMQQAANGMAAGGLPPVGNEQLPPIEGGEVPPAENGEVPPAENGEVPPAEGGENGAEGTENLETQSVSFLNVQGQKFLIEDKNDFLTLIKYINEQKAYKNDKTSEFMNEVDNRGRKAKHVSHAVNPLHFLKENNEFGGLQFKNNKCSMYESDGKISTRSVLTEKTKTTKKVING